MLPELLLAALLALGPPAPIRACLRQRVERIAQDATEASAATGVPVHLLLAVGWAETHLGCDRAEGGGWGAGPAPLPRGPLRADGAVGASDRLPRLCGPSARHAARAGFGYATPRAARVRGPHTLSGARPALAWKRCSIPGPQKPRR